MNERGMGTVTYDKTRGKWIARIPVGRRSNGATIYRKRQAATKREAQEARQALLLERQSDVVAKREPISFRKFADDHMRYEARNELRETTWSGYCYVLRKYVYPKFGDLLLTDIKIADLVKFFTEQRQHLSASQVNYIRSVMSRVFDGAVTHQLIDSNIILRTRRSRPQQGDKTLARPHWNLEECKNAIEVTRGSRFELFLYLAISTGMRHGELLGLQWGDLDLEDGTLHVQRTIAEPKGPRTTDGVHTIPFYNEPKTARGKRTLRLSSDLVDAFKRHRSNQEETRAKSTDWYDSDCVFVTKNGKPYWTSNHSGYLRAFLVERGLRPTTVLALRHGFACNALEIGVDLPSVSRALGHSGIQITMDLYGAGANALQDRATAAIGEYFSSQ